jgi:hypothetical protein
MKRPAPHSEPAWKFLTKEPSSLTRPRSGCRSCRLWTSLLTEHFVLASSIWLLEGPPWCGLTALAKIADKLVRVQAATYGNVTEKRLTPGSTVFQVGGPPPIISSPGQPALATSTIASNSSRKFPSML